MDAALCGWVDLSTSSAAAVVIFIPRARQCKGRVRLALGRKENGDRFAECSFGPMSSRLQQMSSLVGRILKVAS